MARVALAVRARAEHERRRRRRKLDPTKHLFDLHEKQRLVHEDDRRFRVLCCGRRFGKSRLAMSEAVKRSLAYDGPYDAASPPVIVIGMPNLPMAKRVFFRPLTQLLDNHPEIDRVNRSDSIIHIKGDRPDIVCLGLNDGYGERARGLRIWGFLGDEIQAIKRGILDEVVIPAMADTAQSWALLTGTPKGKLNHLYELTERRHTENDWAYYHFLTSDNPHIPREEIDRAKRVLDPRTYRQEYEASFEDFAGKILSEFQERHYMSSITIEFDRVFMGVDWGDRHPAAVVVGYSKNSGYWVVDTWHNTSGQVVPEDVFRGHLVRLANKWDVWRAYCDPSRPSSILALRKLPAAGLKRAIKGYNPIEEGLAVMNSLLHQDRLHVAPHLKHFIDCAEAYHRKTDIDGNIIDKVEDGQDDHELDCSRYVLATIEVKRIMR